MLGDAEPVCDREVSIAGLKFKTGRGVAAALCVCALLGAVGCSPITRTHGYTPRADELDSIKAGVDTRLSVERKLGRPSTIGAFDDEVWLYISQRTETLAFYQSEVVEQRVVLIEFDGNGKVIDVAR